MKSPVLVLPAVQYVASYAEALREGHVCGADSPHDEAEIKEILDNPEAFIAGLNGPKPATFVNEAGVTVERVPSTTVWLMEGNTFIGDAGIRHRLNAVLEKSGGNIGYGVRPSYQGKGYATIMLRECLIWMRDNLGAEKALLSCKVTNVASARVMEKNGGQLIDITPHPFAAGMMQKRFWVPVPPK
jgi:predicted acetyltransferase